MIVIRVFFAFFFFLSCFYSFGQMSGLGIKLNDPLADNGYVLLYDHPKTHLVDNCGKIVHSWESDYAIYHHKLLKSGQLLYMRSDTIYVQGWDGTIDEAVALSDPDTLQKLTLTYEIIQLPNGNFLSVGRRAMTKEALYG